jgi:hypothetical protein
MYAHDLEREFDKLFSENTDPSACLFKDLDPKPFNSNQKINDRRRSNNPNTRSRKLGHSNLNFNRNVSNDKRI